MKVRAAAVLSATLVLGAGCSGGDGATSVVSPTTAAAAAPTAVAPTTVAPTTVAPTTVAPTTVAPTTAAPATTTTPPTEAATLPALVDPLPWTQAASYTGVARMRLARDCTATLVDTGVDAGPAYLVSAGHCTEALLGEQNDVILDRPTGGGARFLRFLDGPPVNLVTEARTVVFATMKGLDLSVVELAGTLGEVRLAGLRPLPLSPAFPAPGTPVTNPAIPVEGVDRDEWLVRLGQCEVAAPVRIAEDRWILDVLPNDCPGLRQGASGSPLVADGRIVGIVGTVAPLMDEAQACQLDHPCELRPGGEVMVPARAYAAPVAALAPCFGPDGRFSLALAGCGLRPGPGVEVVSVPPSGEPGVGSWITEVRGPADRTVRVKRGRATTTRCDDAAGYAAAGTITDGRLVLDEPMPAGAGAYVTCALLDGDGPAQAAASLLLVGAIGASPSDARPP